MFRLAEFGVALGLASFPLSACAHVPPQVAVSVVERADVERMVLAVEIAWYATLRGVEAGIASGAIRPGSDSARDLMERLRAAQKAVQRVREAQATGDAAQIQTLVLEALRAVGKANQMESRS